MKEKENIKNEAVDNKEPTWVKIPGLYHLNIIIDEYKGFKDVEMTIFRGDTKKVPFNPMNFVPKCIPKETLKEPSYVLEQIKEHFTLDEIKQIQKYLSGFSGAHVGKYVMCSIPENGSIMPTGCIPFGGPQDFYYFYEHENYSLPFKIEGYYDLRRHEQIKKPN